MQTSPFTARRRAVLKAIVCAVAPLTLGACGIRMASSGGTVGSSYTEVIDTVLISEGFQHLAVVGTAYDYLFRNTEQLAQLLRSSVHPHLSADFSGFKIGPDNTVRGNLVLYLQDHDQWVLEEAKRLGFTQGFNGDFYLQLPMHGTRYRKNPQLRVGDAYKLNRRYTVSVALAPHVRTERLAPMPLQVAAGGALLLIGLPVIVLFALVRPRK